MEVCLTPPACKGNCIYGIECLKKSLFVYNFIKIH